MKTHCPNCACVIEVVQGEQDVQSCPSCGSRIDFLTIDDVTVSFPRDAREELAHFQLLETLGFGQYGTVWKAKDKRLERLVAVKVPHQRILAEKERSQALREAQSAAQLHHPNIVQVYEVIDTDSVYIVSQWVDGASLKDRMPAFTGDFKKAARLCGELGRALDYAHSQGVIHRDLKPANILIDRHEKPLLTDFGLAKRDGAEMTIAIDGQALGTPAYMPPEQASGQASLADRRSDVYSLGVILYELLVGRRPFSGTSRRALLYQVRMDDPQDPRKIRQDVPVELAAICLRALEKQPDKRYSTAAEMATDLERYLAGEPVSAKPWPWHRKMRAVIRRYPKAATVAVCLAVVVGVAGAAVFREVNRTPSWYATAPVVKFAEVPSGARIVMFRLSERTGMPTGEVFDLSDANQFQTKAPPGLYRVTAHRDNGEFNEVLRTIPESDQLLPLGRFRHRQWSRDDQGAITLPAIELFSQADVTANMVKLAGGTLQTKMDGYVESYDIPGFWIDPHERLDRTCLMWLPLGTLSHGGAVIAWPQVNVSWEEAVATAEAQGKMVIGDPGYEYALDQFTHGDAPPQLGGLQDGLDEWTGHGKLALGRYIVRSEGGRERLFLEPYVRSPNLGFRCVRAQQPSLRISDQIRRSDVTVSEQRFP